MPPRARTPAAIPSPTDSSRCAAARPHPRPACARLTRRRPPAGAMAAPAFRRRRAVAHRVRVLPSSISSWEECVPLVRCPTHGRVYDTAKDAKCPLCLQEENMPRAPGKAKQSAPVEEPSGGRTVLLLLLLVLVGIGAAAYWYISTHNAVDRAQA